MVWRRQYMRRVTLSCVTYIDALERNVLDDGLRHDTSDRIECDRRQGLGRDRMRYEPRTISAHNHLGSAQTATPLRCTTTDSKQPTEQRSECAAEERKAKRQA